MHTSSGSAIAGLVAVALSAGLAAPATAQDFFADKQITLLIGFGPGGTYDYYARIAARHLGRHIPGTPDIVPKQMPGAGSLTAAGFLFSAAPKDGTTIAMLAQTVALEEAIGNPAVKYKSAEMGWIGRITSIAQIQLSLSNSRIKTIADAATQETLTASSGRGSPTEGYPKLLNGVMKARFKPVGPYPGTKGLQALERGDVDTVLASYNTIKSRHADWIADGRVNILVTYALTRHPSLPDVPAFPELGRTGEDKRLLELYVGAEDVGRSLVAPPGLPPERLALLRTAFKAMVEDASFRTEIEKAKAELHPLPGEALQKLVAETVSAPPGLVARMQALLK